MVKHDRLNNDIQAINLNKLLRWRGKTGYRKSQLIFNWNKNELLHEQFIYIRVKILENLFNVVNSDSIHYTTKLSVWHFLCDDYHYVFINVWHFVFLGLYIDQCSYLIFSNNKLCKCIGISWFYKATAVYDTVFMAISGVSYIIFGLSYSDITEPSCIDAQLNQVFSIGPFNCAILCKRWIQKVTIKRHSFTYFSKKVECWRHKNYIP